MDDTYLFYQADQVLGGQGMGMQLQSWGYIQSLDPRKSRDFWGRAPRWAVSLF